MLEAALAVMFILELIFTGMLVFIGFYVYRSVKYISSQSEALSKRESEILDLYGALEEMLREMEKYGDSLKRDLMRDIEKEKEGIRKMLSSVRAAEDKVPVICSLPRTDGKNEKNRIEKKLQNDDASLFIKEPKNRNMKKMEVRALYSRGMSIDEIAKEVNIGKGEVQLILDFKNKTI